MSRTISLSSPVMPIILGQPVLVISTLSGEEALSTLYEYSLIVKTPPSPYIHWQTAANVDIKALIGKEVTATIELDGSGLSTTIGLGKGEREISGIVEKGRFLGCDVNQAKYEIIIRPWLYLATLTSDYKIFQNKTVVEIIEEVLAEYNFLFEKRLSGHYPRLDFQVQYGESDFDFLERIMEEWGIYWFFEHQGQKHKLVLIDHISGHKPNPSWAYQKIEYQPDSPKGEAEYINYLQHQESLTSSRWVTNDYDFTKSRADILAADYKPRQTSFNDLEHYSWPGDYEQPAVGEQLARIRIEELGAQGSRAEGRGELRGMVCGATFRLTGHPVRKVNREYLILKSVLRIVETEQLSGDHPEFSITSNFLIQPANKIYRHPQTIVKPHTFGPQNAIIVGPKGEDVWTDEYGRVKVRFLWDRYGKNRDTDSCWLRVSQNWAGNNFGNITIPRIGHEVIVDFINGDPDRPLITGSLYNNTTMPPWELPANATQSGLISRTINGGKTNYNGVRFEDKPGAEHYWEQAERNMSRLTKNDENQTIGSNSTVSVGVNSDISIGSNSSVKVGGDRSLAVLGNYISQIAVNYTASVLGLASRSVALADSVQVGGARSVAVGGALTTNVGGYVGTNAGGAWTMLAGGAATLGAGGAVAIDAGGVLVISGDVVKIIGKDKVIVEGGEVHVNSSKSDIRFNEKCSGCERFGRAGGAGRVDSYGTSWKYRFTTATATATATASSANTNRFTYPNGNANDNRNTNHNRNRDGNY